MTLRYKTYNSIPNKHFISGVIDNEAELEVFANVVRSAVLQGDEDEGPRVYVTNFAPQFDNPDVNAVTILVELGAYVSWQVNTSGDAANGALVVPQQTTG